MLFEQMWNSVNFLKQNCSLVFSEYSESGQYFILYTCIQIIDEQPKILQFYQKMFENSTINLHFRNKIILIHHKLMGTLFFKCANQTYKTCFLVFHLIHKYLLVKTQSSIQRRFH